MRSAWPGSRHPADVHRTIRAALSSSGYINWMDVFRQLAAVRPNTVAEPTYGDQSQYAEFFPGEDTVRIRRRKTLLRAHREPRAFWKKAARRTPGAAAV